MRHPRSSRLLASLAVMGFVSSAVAGQPMPQSETPSPRSGYVMAHDSARDRLVLFGGSPAADSDPSRLGDTWEWDGTTWSEKAIDGPPPGYNGAMAFDAARQQIVLFGGSTADGRSAETWLYNGASWRRAATTGPSARALSAMAYDTARERVVLFGGSGGGGSRLEDTWEWDGERWQERPVTGSRPSGRGAHAMAGHSARGTVMLYSGWDGETTPPDLWEWDGDAWRLVTDEGPPRLHAAFGYDASRDRLVLFGGFGDQGREGDTWEWSETGWKQVSVAGAGVPPGRAEHEGAWIDGRGFAVFGGIVGQGMAVADRDKDDTLWIWDGEAWSTH